MWRSFKHSVRFSVRSLLAGSCALRLLLLLRPRGSRNICKTALGPAYVRWVSWCAVCAVRYGTRVSSSRRGVPRYRGACAPSPPGITEVPPPRVHPARARSFVQELNFGPIAIQRDGRKISGRCIFTSSKSIFSVSRRKLSILSEIESHYSWEKKFIYNQI